MTPFVRRTNEIFHPRAEPSAFGCWVSPQALGTRLDAPYFDPAFEEIEALIAARPGEVVRLSDIVSEVVQRPRRDQPSQVAPNDELPFIAAASISSHAMLDTDRSVLPTDQREEVGACVDTEGIIANTIASRYQFAYYSPAVHGAPIVLSPYLALLITREGIDPAFLANELCHSYVTLQIARLVRYAIIPKLTIPDLLSVRVALPRQQTTRASPTTYGFVPPFSLVGRRPLDLRPAPSARRLRKSSPTLRRPLSDSIGSMSSVVVSLNGIIELGSSDLAEYGHCRASPGMLSGKAQN